MKRQERYWSILEEINQNGESIPLSGKKLDEIRACTLLTWRYTELAVVCYRLGNHGRKSRQRRATVVS
ncbi:MAG: hypothetical protein A2087_00200 [Spirochaetes bacterium GWD1_61_31]|nr:MAG: hypothetical protein A2087_00200 [Spirochaetes bacterium GWD1_61_31]